MADFGFTFEGLDELEKDLTEAIKEYPVAMKSGLRKIANEFKNSCKKRTPDGKYSKKTEAKLRKKFGVRMLEDGVATVALVYNSGRHFHLVENGHNLVRGGKIVGFVPGKHMMEITRNEYAEKIPNRFKQLRDETLRRHDL